MKNVIYTAITGSVLVLTLVITPILSHAGQIPKSTVSKPATTTPQILKQASPKSSEIMGRSVNTQQLPQTAEASNETVNTILTQAEIEKMTLPQLLNTAEQYDPSSYAVFHSLEADKEVSNPTPLKGISISFNGTDIDVKDCQALGLSDSCIDWLVYFAISDSNNDGEFDVIGTLGPIVNADTILASDQDVYAHIQQRYELGRQVLLQIWDGLRAALDASGVQPQLDKVRCSTFDEQGNSIGLYQRYKYVDPLTGAMMSMLVGNKGGCEIDYIMIKRLLGDLKLTIYATSPLMPSNIDTIKVASPKSVVPIEQGQPLDMHR